MAPEIQDPVTLRQERLEEFRSLQGEARLRLLEGLHPADQADLLDDVAPAERLSMVRAMGCEPLARALEFMEDEPRRRVVEALSPEDLSCVLDEVESSMAADILRELPDDLSHRVLEGMDRQEWVEKVLTWPEDTAGGLMSPDVLRLRGTWTVEQTLAHLREQSLDVEQPFYLYVVDSGGRLKGVVSLRSLIVAEPGATLESLMIPDVVSIPADADQEVAAERMRHYGLMALPVVDDRERLVGVLVADDILEVQAEEAGEDLVLQAGVESEASLLAPLRESLRRRAPWLAVNLVMGGLTALLVSFFDETIAKAAALAAFMPIVGGHAGNTGTQSSSMVLRDLALGEWRPACLGEVLRRELSFGLTYGVMAGVAAGALAVVLTGSIPMTILVFGAMVASIVLGDLMGVLVPVGLKAVGADPALAATMWLTTLTDWLGFALLLGLGASVLP